MAGQDPGEELLGRKSSGFSRPARTFPAKMYKFVAKMNPNVPFPCHGQKNVNQIPPQELLGRKNLIFLSNYSVPLFREHMEINSKGPIKAC